MNVNFKVYWNNPIEMSTEAGTQQLTFEVPLGAIISNPSIGGGTTPYPSLTGNADKVLTVNATEDDVEWTTPVTQVYVDTQDGLLQDQIDLKADAIAMNQVLSTKADLVGGVIPSFQLPSYVDDVLSFVNLASFPVTGEDGKIYIAEDVNKTYRWGGGSYVEIGGGGVALGETSSTAYRGDRGKIAYDHSQSQGNPHNTTTSEITEGTNKYFTDLRVRNTVLSGLVKTDSSNVTNTDTIEVAVGKLATKSEAGGSVTTWVSANSIGTVHPSITGMEFAKIDGNLWVRGYYNWLGANLQTSTVLFTLTSANYRIDTPNSAISELPVGLFSVCTNEISMQQAVVKCIANNRYYFKIYPNVVFNQSNYGIIQPTAIGKLV